MLEEAVTCHCHMFVGDGRLSRCLGRPAWPFLLESFVHSQPPRRASRRRSRSRIVGPTLAKSVPELRWPLIRLFALRPVISFAYFPRGQRLWFNDFANRDVRIANGLKAFSLATHTGWPETEASLARYGASTSNVPSESKKIIAELSVISPTESC